MTKLLDMPLFSNQLEQLELTIHGYDELAKDCEFAVRYINERKIEIQDEARRVDPSHPFDTVGLRIVRSKVVVCFLQVDVMRIYFKRCSGKRGQYRQYVHLKRPQSGYRFRGVFRHISSATPDELRVWEEMLRVQAAFEAALNAHLDYIRAQATAFQYQNLIAKSPIEVQSSGSIEIDDKW